MGIANSKHSINLSYYVLLGTVLGTALVITTQPMETDSEVKELVQGHTARVGNQSWAA